MGDLPGARIAEARNAAGVSQRDFAETIGVSQPLVSQWERGHRMPTVPDLVRVADELGRSLDWLCGRE